MRNCGNRKEVMRWEHRLAIGASVVLGLIFIISGVGKLLNQADFFGTLLSNSFLTRTLAHVVVSVLPWIESVLGTLLIIGILAKLMSGFTLVLIAAFITNHSWLIAHGRAYDPCGCFGIFKHMIVGELSTMGSLSIDAGMVGLVFVILFCYPGDWLTVRPWFFRKR